MAAALPSTNPCCSSPCTGLRIDIVTPIPPITTCCPTAGHGSPEGILTGLIQGALYTDLDTGALYKFVGTVGESTGWV